MNKNILKSSFALFAAALLASCSLDEYNPVAADTSAGLSTDFDKWYGMQSRCYEPIYGQMYTVSDFLSVAEAGTDLWLTSKNNDNTKELFYYEGLVPYAGKGWDKFFSQAYSALGYCCTTIDNGEKMEQTDAVKELYAEARFLRGYYHLMLTTYYGPITLVTQDVEKGVNLTPKRNTLTEIYNSVISDLEYAMNHLSLTPYNNNRARASKKSAVGFLCRAYAQAAGQGLTAPDGTSYWQKAADLAADFVADTEAGGSKYGGYLYSDIADVWNQANNRTNKEALFVAAGVDAGVDTEVWNNSTPGSNKLFSYTYWDPSKLSDISMIKKDKQDYLYGRTNNSLYAPSKYLIDLYNPSWDKRWENSFQTAFGGFSMQQCAWIAYKKAIATINDGIITKYGLDPAVKGQKIYPFADCNGFQMGSTGGNQYTASIWPKGETSGDVNKLEKTKNPYVIEYDTDPESHGLAKDENRIFLYLSKDDMTQTDKKGRAYACVNINDLFDGKVYISSSTGNAWEQKYGSTNPAWQAFPSLIKFQWNYDGVFNGGNLQVKNGDVFIMRSSEIYMIAAEAYQKLGDGQKAAQYINKLRKRAARAGVEASTYELKAASEQDVLDEFARELCGEHQRWALLQRHGKLTKDYLQTSNPRAAEAIKACDKWRPMSQTFLQQIDNAEEYGDNGYGTTAKSGLDGYEQ